VAAKPNSLRTSRRNLRLQIFCYCGLAALDSSLQIVQTSLPGCSCSSFAGVES
jgi:hypothetical protein